MTIEDLKIENRGSSLGIVTISVGVISVDHVTQSELFHSRALLEMADRALYQAKENGRNCSVVIT